jgi:hypothetical protein
VPRHCFDYPCCTRTTTILLPITPAPETLSNGTLGSLAKNPSLRTSAENRKLRTEQERIVSENTEMNEIIEKLKQLDVQMEKKRKELQ